MIKHPWLTLGAVLVISLVAFIGTSRHLKTQSGILDLYSKDDPMEQAYEAYIDQFGTTEDLVVVLESQGSGQNPKRITAAVDAVAARLATHTDLIRSLYYRMDLTPLETHALYFLTAEERKSFKTALEDPKNPLHALAYAPKPHFFLTRLSDKIVAGEADSSAPQRELDRLTQFMEKMAASVGGTAEPPEKAWRHFLKHGKDEREKIFDEAGYLRAEPGLYLLFVQPLDTTSDTEKNAALVRRVRNEIAALTTSFPNTFSNIKIGVTGAPALNADQFAVAQADMTYASIFSLIAIAIVFMLAFHEWIRPALASLSLVIGILWSFGFTTLTVGHLNLFSLAFASMLVSQGNDFSIHLVSRYEEELLRGLNPLAALAKTLRVSGKSVFFGALTTACAFWTTLTVDLRGFAELGWIAGSGLLICVLATCVSLPCMLYIRDRRRWRPDRPLAQAASHESSFFKKWGEVLQRHAGKIEVTLLVLSALCLYAVFSPQSRFGFDYNLLNLQAKGTEAVRYEEKLVEAHLTPRNAIWMPDRSLPRAAIDAKTAAFKALSSVERVESLESLIPPQQDETHAFIQALAVQHQLNASALTPSSASEWQSAFAELDLAFRSIQNKAFKSGRADLLPYSDRLRKAVAALQTSLDLSSESDFNARMDAWNKAFFSDFRGFLSEMLAAPPLTLSDYPATIRERFISKNGTQAIHIIPKGSIWERPELTQFITEIRGVEAGVTGNPVQMYETLERVRTGYTKSGIYAFIAIFIVTLIDFRSIKHAALCTASLGIAMLWLFGLMSVTGLAFNIANLIAVPIILGIGIDSSIHVFHRYREKRDWADVFCHTGKAISLTNLTTLLGFVGMALSRHQGLASMGQILLLGLSLCFIASLVIWPVFLMRFEKIKSSGRLAT